MHLERHPGTAETEGGRLDGVAGVGESLRDIVPGKAHEQGNPMWQCREGTRRRQGGKHPEDRKCGMQGHRQPRDTEMHVTAQPVESWLAGHRNGDS